MNDTPFHMGQKAVIQQLEEAVAKDSISFSTVSAPEVGFEEDDRMCLTSVHFPNSDLMHQIQSQIIQPLQAIDASPYYYGDANLHFTIKNIRTISTPPSFNDQDIAVAKQVFSQVLSRHKAFQVYYYRLLLFPNNLALVGTTDPEFDDLVLDLDTSLKQAGVPDSKQYVNTKYFFSNITLARFMQPVSEQFKEEVKKISTNLAFEPYKVDTIALVTANAVMKRLTVLEQFALQG